MPPDHIYALHAAQLRLVSAWPRENEICPSAHIVYRARRLVANIDRQLDGHTDADTHRDGLCDGSGDGKQRQHAA